MTAAPHPSAAEAADSAFARRRPRLRVNRGDGLPLRFWSDLGEPVQPDRLIRRLLGETALILIYGEPGCGKTFLATDMGLAIAIRRAWFGRTVSPGAVLYVAAEGAAGLANRILAFKARNPTPEDVPFVIVPVSVNLGIGDTDTAAVIAAAREVEARTGQAVKLVIIDTLARAIGAGDENLAADMGRFIVACDQIRETTGASVMIVHHKGKAANGGARGSSALLGAVDTAIEVEKRESGRVARVVKQKDGSDGEEIGFTLDVVEIGRDEDGEAITSCVVQQTDDVAKRAPKLSHSLKRALEALHNLLVDKGELAPKGVTFPNVTRVKLDLFREHLQSVGVTERNNDRMQWKRIKDGLANAGVFAMKDEWCWSTVTERNKP
ncbi:MAG: AAA family ATPase [Alphaproteobacteria bacterium]|nr:AAA family ATPase [Alphaproteobacteria bacterium]